VASISVYAPFYAVFDMRTGALIQTFFNTSDGHDSFGEIHLAPNGKIVTDHAYVGTTLQKIFSWHKSFFAIVLISEKMTRVIV
jgi:hypothetical protein